LGSRCGGFAFEEGEGGVGGGDEGVLFGRELGEEGFDEGRVDEGVELGFEGVQGGPGGGVLGCV
jgi:hypothetical protein